jgi:hypothetical protein
MIVSFLLAHVLPITSGVNTPLPPSASLTITICPSSITCCSIFSWTVGNGNFSTASAYHISSSSCRMEMDSCFPLIITGISHGQRRHTPFTPPQQELFVNSACSDKRFTFRSCDGPTIWLGAEHSTTFQGPTSMSTVRCFPSRMTTGQPQDTHARQQHASSVLACPLGTNSTFPTITISVPQGRPSHISKMPGLRFSAFISQLLWSTGWNEPSGPSM